jgi:hypothetical protein
MKDPTGFHRAGTAMLTKALAVTSQQALGFLQIGLCQVNRVWVLLKDLIQQSDRGSKHLFCSCTLQRKRLNPQVLCLFTSTSASIQPRKERILVSLGPGFSSEPVISPHSTPPWS